VSNALDFNDTILQYLDGLYSYARTLCRNPAEAEDLVQETYFRAVRAYAQLAPDSNVKSWMCTIMRNIRLNALRQQKKDPNFVEFDSEPEGGSLWVDRAAEDPYDLYVTRTTRAEVRQAIEQLPTPYREVIILREFQDLSYGEIASILGCPTGTVMSRLGRAREKLRDLLQSCQRGTLSRLKEATL
jgi:RNA polymerase sigma-70 factor, ECF subfamily